MAGLKLSEVAETGPAAEGVEADGAVQEWLAERAVVMVEADLRKCCHFLLPWPVTLQLWETGQRQVLPDPVNDKDT